MSKATRHLWRAAFIGLLAVCGFIGLRTLMVPASFGSTGPYRAEAPEEEAARKELLPDQKECKPCHEARYEKLQGGAHKLVHCKHCHGTAREHVDRCKELAASGKEGKCAGPESGVTDLYKGINSAKCDKCHHPRVGPPKGFPMIDISTHPQEMGAEPTDDPAVCGECHDGHDPTP